MAFLEEERLRFHFASNTQAFAYDQAPQYRTLKGRKAVDFIAWRISVQSACWLVEVKDFRTPSGAPGEKNTVNLPKATNLKVRHTLSDLGNWPRQADGFRAAEAVKGASTRRVVLHMEQHAGSSKFLKGVPSQAFVRQKLKQLLKDIDPEPLVLDIASTARANVPWRVTSK